MVGPTAALAQHALAGPAAPRRSGGSLARTRPQQHTLTPCQPPTNASPCRLKCCAPTMAYSTIQGTKAHHMPPHGRPAARSHTRARGTTRTNTVRPSGTRVQHHKVPHWLTLAHMASGRQSTPHMAVHRCTPARLRQPSKAWRCDAAHARARDERDHSTRSSTRKTAMRMRSARATPASLPPATCGPASD